MNDEETTWTARFVARDYLEASLWKTFGSRVAWLSLCLFSHLLEICVRLCVTRRWSTSATSDRWAPSYCVRDGLETGGGPVWSFFYCRS